MHVLPPTAHVSTPGGVTEALARRTAPGPVSGGPVERPRLTLADLADLPNESLDLEAGPVLTESAREGAALAGAVLRRMQS